MESLRLLGLILGQWATGYALLALAPPRVLRRMLRLEKAGAALLIGLMVVPYLVLLTLLAGVSLSGRGVAAICAAGALVLLLRFRRWDDLASDPVAGPAIHQLPLLPPPLRVYAFLALTGLIAWLLLAAAFLPPGDYDSFSLWSYRVRVLLAERSFYVEALLDPVRFIPARQHPYLMPVMEVLPALALGRFSFAAVHVPHVMAWAGFLMLSLAAVRREQAAGHPARALALLAGLVLMPAASVQLSQESVREILIGYYGLASVYFLAHWIETPRALYLVCSALFGITTQQIKVEGVPFVLGLALGSALLLVTPGNRRLRALRLRQWAGGAALAVLVAAPYWYVLTFRMPDPTAHGYDFTADLNVTVFEQFRSAAIVAWVSASELFARPELYGFALYAALVCGVRGWRRRNALARIALLGAPAACLVAVLIIYVGRNHRLPPERNVTFSRRMMCALPALVFAAIHLPRPRFRYRSGGEERRSF